MYKFPSLLKLSQVEGMVKALREKPRFYTIDFETTGLDPRRDTIVGVSVCWSPTGAVYIPVSHKHDQPYERMNVINILRPLLTDYLFGAFNAVFELEFLEHDWRIIPNQMPVDVSLLTYVQGKYEFQKLDVICREEFPELGVITYDEFMGKSNLQKKHNISEAPVYLVADYCGRDALSCFMLYKKYNAKTSEHPIYRLERALFPEIVRMRRTGFLVDKAFWAEENARLEEELSNLKKIIEQQVSEYTGKAVSFDIQSYQQLAGVLYDELGFKCKRFTDKGARRTDKDTLNVFRWKSPIVRNIITYKEIAKRKNTYYNKYQIHVQGDGRIYSSYNQTGASTGRLSSSDPNLQNLPDYKSWVVERDKGSYKIETNVRKGFIVPDDCWLLEADYSQIEAKIAAGVTREPVLLNAFKEGIDYHTKTASLIYGVPLSVVTKEQRFMGKKLNFALSYGMGVDKLFHTLREEVDINYEQAKIFRKKYMEAYATMFHEAKMIAKLAEKQGYVETIWGRRVPVRPNKGQDSFNFQGTYNYKIQGSAADLLKYSIFKVGEYLSLNYEGEEAKILTTIHDSIGFEVKKSVNLAKFITDILEKMTYQQKGFPIFTASMAVGQNLGELEEMGKSENVTEFVQRLLVSTKREQKEKVSKTFILEIESGEGRKPDQIKRLKELVKENPGDNELVLKIGELEKLVGTVSLDASARETVLFIMGGKYYERL